MANLTVTYKGSTIHTASASGSATLETGGTWCEADIGLSYTFDSGGGTLGIIVYTLSGATVTASDGTDTYTGVETSAGVYEIDVPDYGTYTVTALKGGMSVSDTVTLTETSTAIPFADPVLENNTWAKISEVSAAHLGPNLWSVGDTKSVALNGTCGTLSLNTTLYAYILGFDHNSAKEGYGIHFGTFKTAASNGESVALVDSYVYTNKSDGTKTYNLNHWGTTSGTPYNSNYGGWKGSDIRYDVLGSTDIEPSGYGSANLTSRVGYDASSTTATSPVSDTLMSCLPSALRAVMKPITKYTDNTGNSSNVSSHVTASVDYLPMLAEFEIFGVRTYANQYEQNSQAQYAYYSAGNSKIKQRHNDLSASVHWWERSPSSGYNWAFCRVLDTGAAYSNNARISCGLAALFVI